MKAVLFDLDDTLYPEHTFVESGFRAVAAHLADEEALDEEDLFQAMLRVLDREGRGKVFDTVLRDLDRYRPELVRTLVQVYRTHPPKIRLFGDVTRGLQHLRAADQRLGIVTDGLASVQRSKIHALGLEPRVDAIVCTDEMGEGKPSIAPFRLALDLLEAAPSESTYVGDDPGKDFQGPRELGMRTVHMHRKVLDRRLARGGTTKADLHVETFKQLVRSLEI